MVIFSTVYLLKFDHFMKKIALLLISVNFLSHGFSQSLITMSNKCYEMVKTGNAANESGQYDQALNTFETVLSECSAKDAKESGNAGKARALNGLNRHEEAITAADAALKASRNTSIAALFERADAHYSLNQIDEATEDYKQITAISAKNENVKERASIFAKLAELDFKQNRKEDALDNIDKAISLDPSNASWHILKGDFYAKDGDLDAAFESYDKALETSSDKASIYKLRAFAFTNAMQEKHHTRDAAELKSRMSGEEKQQFCKEWKRVFDGGYKNAQQDLYYSLICL
jgi:tetratricopeptide (TPR) repeat protein